MANFLAESFASNHFVYRQTIKRIVFALTAVEFPRAYPAECCGRGACHRSAMPIVAEETSGACKRFPRLSLELA
jgi:hypothetical protein